MEATMGYRARQEYFRTQRRRYFASNRAGKARMLDEAEALFGEHRKSLIRAFARAPRRSAPPRRGARTRYGPEHLRHLKALWRLMGGLCSRRLAAAMATWLPFYERHRGVLSPEVCEGLLEMSPSTMDRLLAPVRARRGLAATSRARLAGLVPVRSRLQELAQGPGWLEADTVAHGGPSAAGAFLWSLTLTDIATGWTENRAVWNRNARQVVARLTEIEEVLPFDILELHSDSGREFINQAVLRHFREHRPAIPFTRSRPYHKNDNAHVEQRQHTHVRELLGYDRLEERRLVRPVNDLYAGPWRALQNFFLPTVRLLGKSRDAKGHRHRRHSVPLTPCERLLQSSAISPETKDALRRQRDALDPIALREDIEGRQREIFRIAREARAGHPTTLPALMRRHRPARAA
jgi:hypothetical protein